MVESYFARHADAVDAMLLTARLSGVFAAYAWQYSTYVENQMPCLARKDRWMSPEQIVTSVPPDWGKIKVFGCDAYELIPNNKLKNTLELPEGENCCLLVTFVAE